MTRTLEVSPTVKVLTETRRLLAERGWCQAALEDHRGQFCLLGAMLHAVHGRVMGDANSVHRGVYDALGRAAGVPATASSLVVWNNGFGRTRGEVLATLDRAISMELGVP